MRDDIAAFARVAGVVPGACSALPWCESLTVFGLELPADYRAFVDSFGAGTVGSRLTLSTPWPLHIAEAGVTTLRVMLDRAAEIGVLLRGLREDFPALFPYAFHPEPGGLLSWAGGVGGEQCFWLTEASDPDDWSVVVWDKADWRRYDMGMVALLIRALTGTDPFLNDLVAPAPGRPLWNPRR
ncbi:hypothetical protein [Streptomyces sp. NBC_00378]|uniref:hypothetical protein n=1 Tax=unclassified Streptomyces TaxID=2593676 RepID=UPI0022545CCC|nr:hypothetical protein [Streptomyces sp. NBC_00378]